MPCCRAGAGRRHRRCGSKGRRQDVDALVDLRHLRSPDTALLGMRRNPCWPHWHWRAERLALDFENGSLYVLRRAQRWRFWRSRSRVWPIEQVWLWT
jgi:hypothetical protein